MKDTNRTQTANLHPPSASRRAPWLRATPVIRRQGINWRGGNGVDPLVLVLDFENPGETPTMRTGAVVRVAAFGAFLEWAPLIKVNVPSIAPGEHVTLVVDAESSEEDSAPLSILLARGESFGQASMQELPNARGLAAIQGIRRGQQVRLLRRLANQALDSRLRSLHFAGNLNVFVDGQIPVERHRNHAYGLRPSCDNFANFEVGDGQRDTYTLRLEAESGWEVTLLDREWGKPMALSHELVTATIKPPAGAVNGRVTVWVTRKSSGQEVAVEFDLLSDAP